jgi:hypothetical protein
MSIRPIYFLVLTLISFCFTSKGQEVRGLNYQHKVETASKKIQLKATGDGTNPVPKPDSNIFFDDFSTYGTNIYPESDNWIDKNATITLTYSDSAISFGVVTLDCFDSQGQVYGPTDRTNASDTLTSNVIDSIYGENNYLSFFIQGGGKVDAPEEEDSLLVEFYDSKSEDYVLFWSTTGYESHTFEQIILPIPDSLLEKDSTFQFRFINYTSLSADEVQGNEGALSNADNWHIDYVQIKNVNDINKMKLINDISIYEPLKPVFLNYSSIPYNHIQYSAGYLRGTNTINFRTDFPDTTNNLSIKRSHIYIDINNTDTLEKVGGNGGIELATTPDPNSFFEVTDNFIPIFKTYKYPSAVEGTYHLKSYLNISSHDQYLWNDTITREEIYKDYYAYDDGSAEFGFGITGSDAYNSAFASEFELYYENGAADLLSGVYIYFNQAADDYTTDLEFQVLVWDSEDGTPGELLYPSTPLIDQNFYTPDTSKTLNNPTSGTNGFMRIEFDNDISISGNFFVGIYQYTEDFLNVGYDISLDSKSKIWYFTQNEWSSAANLTKVPNGSLMIRPIFGHEFDSGINTPSLQETKSVTIYPNPIKESFSIKLPEENSNYYQYQLSIYNLLGERVVLGTLEETTNISYLPQGAYILQLYNTTTQNTYSQKILKTE